MINRNAIMVVGAMCAGLLDPAQASAETAITDVNLNLRVGPSTSYGVIDVIPQGHPVEVIGCLDHYDWCDVAWEGLRGWVAARYLAQPGTSVYLPQWGPTIGVPTVSFSFTIYHDRHYDDQPWHRERRWSGRWRDRRDAHLEAESREEIRIELRQEQQRAEESEGRRPESRRALQQRRGPKAEPPGRALGHDKQKRRRKPGRGH